MAKEDTCTRHDSALAMAEPRSSHGRPVTKGRSGQTVTMSEEGKKRQVLGQLMSSFFNDEKAGGRLDR